MEEDGGEVTELRRKKEAMVVAGVELTPDNTLKQLRTACEFLRIGNRKQGSGLEKVEACDSNKQDEGNG